MQLPGVGELRRLQARLGDAARRRRAASAPVRWAATDTRTRARCGQAARALVEAQAAPHPRPVPSLDRAARGLEVPVGPAHRLRRRPRRPRGCYQRGLVVDLTTQRRGPNGEWSTPKQFALREDQWADAPDPMDRQIAQMLTGAGSDARHFGSGYGGRATLLPRAAAFGTTLRLMCESGRCRVSLNGESDPLPLTLGSRSTVGACASTSCR